MGLKLQSLCFVPLLFPCWQKGLDPVGWCCGCWQPAWGHEGMLSPREGHRNGQTLSPPLPCTPCGSIHSLLRPTDTSWFHDHLGRQLATLLSAQVSRSHGQVGLSETPVLCNTPASQTWGCHRHYLTPAQTAGCSATRQDFTPPLALC